MYTRGQFAIIGKVGRKALRIWDEEGLLTPSYVNEETGYNYYDESQLATLDKIKKFRKIGLSIYEIKQIFDGQSSEKELVDSKIREMDLHLQEVRELTDKDEEETVPCSDIPDITSFNQCRCLYIDENTDLENLGISVGKLYEKASLKGINPLGSHFVIYKNLANEEGFSMRTCLPVSDYNGDDSIEVFEEKCLHIRFTEGFSKVATAHILIKEYAGENRISCADKVYEVYNRDMSVDVYQVLV